MRVNGRGNALHLLFLGPLRVLRNGEPVTLARSRKLRALLAYLALAPRPVGRSSLCELLWDGPDDPRGELRWCLSRLRAAIDSPGRSRVITQDDMISLDLTGCTVDALEVTRAAHAGLEKLDPRRRQQLAATFAGDFLEGFELPDNLPFRAWLTATRRQLRSCQVALLAGSRPTTPAVSMPELPPRPGPRRASIAVMPFADESAATQRSLGEALACDITTRLAKLRSLFVIAQGSTFALHARRIGPEEAGRMLDVDYVLTGAVRRPSGRLRLSVDLVETRSARLVWSEQLNHASDDALLALDAIGNSIVASIAAEIETVERNRAILRPPNSLDAWEAHHRGLWHMYRFTREDNQRARHFFGEAIRLDPTFSRAHAGLSFTHFQSAFQGWAPRPPDIDRAFGAASQALLADDRDPAAHWAMGRALWLRGEDQQAVGELRHAIELSPNFALGHYALAFVQAQTGDPEAAIASSDCSQSLSPYDPLLFAMLGTRAMALLRLGRFEEAAQCATRAAARPNAHAHIYAIAAYSLALAGKLDEARAHAAAVRRSRLDYGLKDFLGTFRFGADGEALFRKAAGPVGLV